MAIINVALSDTFDTWRTKTNTLGTNIGDMALLDSDFAATDLVSALNEIRAGEEFTQIDLPDSTTASVGRLKLGDDDDFQIYHNGAGSVIDNATGSITIRTAGAGSILLQDVGGNDLAQFNDNADVKLYHNANLKIATTADGVNVTGEVDMDTLKMPDVTAGKILIGDGTSYEEQAVSGDITIDSTGVVAISSGVITSPDFNNVVTLIIYDSSGSAVKTLRTPGS